MACESLDWVSVDDAILAHQQSIANYGGSDGVRDAGGLQRALAYPQNLTAYGEAKREQSTGLGSVPHEPSAPPCG